MAGMIGEVLASMAHAASMPATATHNAAAAGTSFADQLDASFRQRAARLGLDLPGTPGVAPGHAAASDSADDAWQLAQAASLALGHGPGDAMMAALADAAEQRHDRTLRGSSQSLDMLVG